jgi:preprotein translocase subunit YajC
LRGSGWATLAFIERGSQGARGMGIVIGMNMMDWLPLAQVAEDGADKAQDAPAAPPGLGSMWPALVGIMVLFYFLILRPQKSKDQQFRSLIDNLKETDRVVTIGGIHGVVTNVQRDAGVVTLRVDDSTGAKIRVGTSAIARVVVDEEKAS